MITPVFKIGLIINLPLMISHITLKEWESS